LKIRLKFGREARSGCPAAAVGGRKSSGFPAEKPPAAKRAAVPEFEFRHGLTSTASAHNGPPVTLSAVRTRSELRPKGRLMRLAKSRKWTKSEVQQIVAKTKEVSGLWEELIYVEATTGDFSDGEAWQKLYRIVAHTHPGLELNEITDMLLTFRIYMRRQLGLTPHENSN
jgi:hypothetical protein